MAYSAQILINAGGSFDSTDGVTINHLSEGSRPAVIDDLKDKFNQPTGIRFQWTSSGGLFWNRTCSETTQKFNNDIAKSEVLNNFGMTDATLTAALSTYMTNGQGSRTNTLSFSGLSVGESVTLYLFGTTDNTNTGDTLPTGFTASGGDNGKFEYASSTGIGWQDNIPTNALNGEMMLIKWTGILTSDTLTIQTEGDNRFGYGFAALKTVPEPSSATLGLLSLGSLLLRRKRT